ncbi:MAG: enoyl-CoA hydratase-related protein [Alphaproteobacteria bacterium]|jgi:enoyl-CoA hydratase/carnithine racemase|nr:enoyl-CoA hydratase [Rhodospirillaceae bacterium]MDP6405714.1 enoyl-CoA hydratase-related protein [Alphaproteobacteria bacterium]MDP6624665.1 enoyl-CoA hydratase-related protein [Alphaproteobacteria bacterium]|tara:strand:+ start:1293 stop:2081 length:789 start_codon:yes stop_codon:yes gene_type:complete
MNNPDDVLLIQRDPQVLRLTVNRPERRNALTVPVFSALRGALTEAEEDPEIRAIVLTGAGDKAFSAGADLKPDTEYSPLERGTQRLNHPIVDLFHVVEGLSKPLVARVNGHAMAGGMGLLAMCDLAVAVDDAKFALPEARIGLFPLLINTYLQRLLPYRTLMELCLTGEAISAQRAAEIGLINHVVPRAELDARVDELLASIVANAPQAVRRGRLAMRAMRDMGLGESFAFAQTEVIGMFNDPDFDEGIAAFNEKRPPRWSS